MGVRRIIIDVPEEVLAAEETDEATFARELSLGGDKALRVGATLVWEGS